MFEYREDNHNIENKNNKVIAGIIFYVGLLATAIACFGTFWWFGCLMYIAIALQFYTTVTEIKNKYKISSILKSKKDVLILSICCFIVAFSACFLEKSFWFALLFVMAICFAICFVIYRIKYTNEISNMPYIRTKEGEKLNKKIEGLKNYTRDYSLLGEREAEEIELWEDYLVYSVIWGQNTKIVEEYEKYIEIEDENSMI